VPILQKSRNMGLSSYSKSTQEGIEWMLGRRTKEDLKNYVLAMMCIAKQESKDDFNDLVQDGEFIAFMKSALGVDISTYAFDENFIFEGVCRCGMSISKSINDPRTTRDDHVRYFYTNQKENEGYNIFRCKQCKKPIDECWSRGAKAPVAC